MGKIDTNYLYMVLDLENKELPLFVGTIQEVARYEGKKTNTIVQGIANKVIDNISNELIQLKEQSK